MKMSAAKRIRNSVAFVLSAAILCSGAAFAEIVGYKGADVTGIIAAAAEIETPAEHFTYEYNADGSVSITGFVGDETEIVIPSHIEGHAVTAVGKNAFWQKTDIRRVVIPEGVKSIGYAAFNECTGLKSVVLSDTVTSVEDYVFFDCTGLESVKLGSGLKSIGDYAFFKCQSLKSISLPDSTESMGDKAFYNCSGLKSISTGSLTSLGKYSFGGCSSLETISIGAALGSIDDYAFYKCDSIKEYKVSSKNQNYSAASGVLFNKDKTKLLVYPCARAGKSYVIPKSVTSIDKKAFQSALALSDHKLTNIGIFYDYKYDVSDPALKSFKIFTGHKSIYNKLMKDKCPAVIYYTGAITLMNKASTATAVTIAVTDAPVIDGVKYQYYIYDTKTKKYKLKKTTGAVSYKFTSLKKGKAYKFKVCRKTEIDGKELKPSVERIITASTNSVASANNKIIEKGAEAVIASKKVCANAGLDTASGYKNAESISDISQFSDKDGNVMFAYTSGKKLIIKKLRDDLTAENTGSVKTKLSGAATVTMDDKGNYYVVWFRNYCSKKNDIAITVTKYDKKLKEKGSVSYKSIDIDAVNPGYAGNCDAVVSNGLLYCLYTKKRYDGHQMSDQIVIDTTKMKKADDERISFWCSHSFAQRVITDHNGKVWYANQGDCYPRSFMASSGYGSKDLFHFYCGKSDKENMSVVNVTNAQLGGLADTSRDVFFVGASVKSMEKKGYDSQPKNLFITSAGGKLKLSDSSSRSGTVFGEKFKDKNIKWLTDYPSEYDVVNPQTVSVKDDRFIILWEKHEKKTGKFINSYYAIISSDGNVYQKPVAMKKYRLNAYETPVYKNGCVYWLTASGKNINAVKLTVGDVDPVVKVKLSKTKATLKVGKSLTLKATVTPKKPAEKLTWSTSDKKIATVKNGKVTAKKAGKATITVKTTSGKTAKCKITVKKK